MSHLILSARENHTEISITCPHCKFSSKYSVSYVEDALHEQMKMTCVICNEKFLLQVVPVVACNAGDESK